MNLRHLALASLLVLSGCGFAIARHRPGSLPKARTITHSETVTIRGDQEVHTYTPLENPTVERTGGGRSGGSIGIELGQLSVRELTERKSAMGIDVYLRYLRSKGRTGWSLRAGFGARGDPTEGESQALWIPVVASVHLGDRDGARPPDHRPPILGYDLHAGAGPLVGRLRFGDERSAWLPGATGRAGIDLAISWPAVEFVVGGALVYVVTAPTTLAGTTTSVNDRGVLWHMVLAM